MKIIPTKYNGHYFRSRLEARWAVYFDAIGIEWEYEKEGFDFDGVKYLPDFWLPDVRMWAEVKAQKFTEAEAEKARLLAENSNCPVLILVGRPRKQAYWAFGSDMEYCLSNYHNYPETEHRFYTSPIEEDFDCLLTDIEKACEVANSKRFEYGGV